MGCNPIGCLVHSSYAWLIYMSGVFLGTNIYIISFLGTWMTTGGYWETQKFNLPKSRHCRLTAQLPCYVWLVYSAVFLVLFTCFAFFKLFDMFGLEALFPRVSPFLYLGFPGSQNTLLPWSLTPWAFTSFPKTHECCKISTSSSVPLT